MSKLYIGNKLIIDPDVKLEKVEITQAAYDTLADKKDNIVYCITDAPNQIQYLHEEVESVSKDLKTKFNTLETNIQGDLDRKAEVTDLSNVLADNIVNNPTYEDLSTTTINDLKAELQIDSKLDKDIYETANKQFNQSGYFHFTTHVITTAQGFSNTGYIPLNHNAPIVVKGSGTQHVSAVAFFDYNYGFISNIQYSKLGSTVIDTIPVEEFPAQAAFFMCSSSLACNPTFTNGTNQEARENAVSNLVHEAKKALFIDMWNQICGGADKIGGYNSKTGYFELNGITDIGYDEAIRIYQYMLEYPNPTRIDNINIRTNLIKRSTVSMFDLGPNIDRLFKGSTLLTCRIGTESSYTCRPSSADSVFLYCPNLYAVYGIVDLGAIGKTTTLNLFNAASDFPALKNIKLRRLKQNFKLTQAPNLSLESMQYLINNAANKTPITIEVHPSMYAKLTGDTTNQAAAALTADELAQWQEVLVSATEKGISFVTTE